MIITERYNKETAREYALRMLKKNIINLELIPGTIVSENELAIELGLSRTPVREALIELSKIKVVEILPQRGSHIALINLDLVEEARFFRQVLECAIVKLACERITEEDYLILKENVSLQEFYLESHVEEKLIQLDNDFHKKLFEICRKTHTYSLMKSMTIHFDRVRSLSLTVVKNGKIVADHRKLLEAINLGKQEDALAIIDKHLLRYKVDEKEIINQYPHYFKKM